MNFSLLWTDYNTLLDLLSLTINDKPPITSNCHVYVYFFRRF